MKSDVFYWVLNMSVFGGLLCLINLLLRRCKRLPRGFVFALWALPLLRFLLPFGIRSRWSLAALLERLGARRVSVWGGMGAVNYTQTAGTYFPITYRSNALTEVFETAALIWAIAAGVCLLSAMLLYLRTRAEVRGAIKKDGYYVSERIGAPALYGIFRPRIVLPVGTPPEALPYILLHERTHARRGDNLWRCLAVLVCCLHWFNPICWISLRYFFEDMELACDAAVLRRLDGQARKDYALALLDAAQRQSLFASAFGGAKLRVRIDRILSYRKLTAASTAALVLLFAAVTAVLAMN